MNSTGLVVFLAALLVAIPTLANAQQKAQKELNKVTAWRVTSFVRVRACPQGGETLRNSS